MRRAALVATAALTLATNAHAWQVTADPVCTLSHDSGAASVTVTYDPRLTQPYTIRLARPGGWPAGPVFAIRFDGPRGLTISTTRHTRDQGALSVSDTGFGNVLNGLEFNTTATAGTGDAEVAISLDGAAPAVRAFRACTEGGLV